MKYRLEIPTRLPENWVVIDFLIGKEKEMMKGILNLFRTKKAEEVIIEVEMPTPNFSRQMTIIESSEEEDNDDNN